MTEVKPRTMQGTPIRLDHDKLRELRLMAGLTQEDLARKARCSVASISLYESGQRLNPNPSTTRAMARALGVKPADILTREEVPEEER